VRWSCDRYADRRTVDAPRRSEEKLSYIYFARRSLSRLSTEVRCIQKYEHSDIAFIIVMRKALRSSRIFILQTLIFRKINLNESFHLTFSITIRMTRRSRHLESRDIATSSPLSFSRETAFDGDSERQTSIELVQTSVKGCSIHIV